MANYYDRVLEDFESEGIFDEGIFDEGIFDEAAPRRRPAPKVPSSVARPSNFGRHVTPGQPANQQSAYATKAELKSSLNSISEQVNDLKKSNLSIAATVKDLSEGYDKVIKSIAKKDKAQDTVTNSSTMMSLLGTIANKPSLNADALKIVPVVGGAEGALKVEVDATKDPIQVDLTKTLLFTMMPTMMAGGNSGGNNNMMMMLPLVLLLGKPGGTAAAGGTDSTLILAMMMMMMMNKN